MKSVPETTIYEKHPINYQRLNPEYQGRLENVLSDDVLSRTPKTGDSLDFEITDAEFRFAVQHAEKTLGLGSDSQAPGDDTVAKKYRVDFYHQPMEHKKGYGGDAEWILTLVRLEGEKQHPVLRRQHQQSYATDSGDFFDSEIQSTWKTTLVEADYFSAEVFRCLREIGRIREKFCNDKSLEAENSKKSE
jgi:hypothetical protein